MRIMLARQRGRCGDLSRRFRRAPDNGEESLVGHWDAFLLHGRDGGRDFPSTFSFYCPALSFELTWIKALVWRWSDMPGTCGLSPEAADSRCRGR